jgi:hypothetical protein
MPNVKTAVSLKKPLFDRIEALAREMRISRSGLFALALDEFIRRRENQHLLERLNEAFEAEADGEEQALMRGMRGSHRRIVEGEW